MNVLHKTRCFEEPPILEGSLKPLQLLHFPGFKPSLTIRGQVLVGPNIGIDCFIFRGPCFSGLLKPAGRIVTPPVAWESISKQVFSFFKAETVDVALGTGRKGLTIFLFHFL